MEREKEIYRNSKMQQSLFQPNPFATIAGKTFEPAKDEKRLTGQMERVFELVKDGKWRTLAEIRKALGNRDSEAGISARLRDFRKDAFGAHKVERRRRFESGGLFEYKVSLSGPIQRSIEAAASGAIP